MDAAPNNLPTGPPSCAKYGCLGLLSVHGLVLLGLTTWGLAALELHTIRQSQPLAEAKALGVSSVSSDIVDPAREGALVHLSGQLETDAPARDEEFGITTIPALLLSREVEVMTRENDEMVWKAVKPPSAPEAGQPPTASSEIPLSSDDRDGPFVATQLRMGAFKIANSPQLTDGLDVLPLFQEDPRNETVFPSPVYMGQTGRLEKDGWIYFGANAAISVSEAGDIRAKFQYAPPRDYSIIGQQVGDTIRPFQARNGESLFLIDTGQQTAAKMLSEQTVEVHGIAWMIRLFCGMWLLIGMGMSYWLLKRALGSLPLVGPLLHAGPIAFILLATMGAFLLTIGFSWVVVRPLLGLAVLALAFVMFSSLHGFGVRRLKTDQETEALRALGRVGAE